MIGEFSIEKALQVLGYLQKSSGVQNYQKLIKLEYFAERYHIRKYCVPILGDNFVAMKQGPVASHLYDAIKDKEQQPTNLPQAESIAVKKHIRKISEHDIEIVGITDYRKLSPSVKEALDFAVDTFCRISRQNLITITHQYPEWKKLESLFQLQTSCSASMNYIDFFADPDAVSSETLRNIIGVDPYKNEHIEEAKKIFKYDTSLIF